MSSILLPQGTATQCTKHARSSSCLLNVPLLPGHEPMTSQTFVFPIPTKLFQSNTALQLPALSSWVSAWQGSSDGRSGRETLQQSAELRTATETVGRWGIGYQCGLPLGEISAFSGQSQIVDFGSYEAIWADFLWRWTLRRCLPSSEWMLDLNAGCEDTWPSLYPGINNYAWCKATKN